MPLTLRNITQAELREIFDYDPDGFLVWRRPSKFSPKKPGERAGASLDKDGYCRFCVNRVLVPLHRAIYFWHHGELPARIDHIDRDRTNNRIENLRPASCEQNSQNAKNKSSATGVKGVYYRAWDNRYQAYAAANGKRIARYAKTLAEAEALAIQLRNELHGDYACHD